MDLPTGYAWRPLRPDDVDEVLALHDRWEQHHDLPFRSDRAEVEHDLAAPEGNLGDWSLCAVDAENTMRGLGWVFRRNQEGVPKQRVLVWVMADPEHSHLEDPLIGWCDETAAGILAPIEDGLDKVLRAWSPSHAAERIANFERHGYHVARYFSTLSRQVAGAAAPSPPAGVALADWNDELNGRAIFEAHVEAFLDHWGSVPADWRAWQRDYVGNPHTRLDLSVVALAGNDVVGYSLNQVYPEDARVRGLTEGYLGTIGVRRAWRRKGVATALILDSIRRFAEAGFDNATLTADADSLTGAFELYQRLGFIEVDTDVTLVKELSG